MTPFTIDGPAVISFSGGRTSGYMLRRILDEGVRSDVHVLFANTGRERPETLDFVRDCQSHWGIDVHWVERLPNSTDTPPGFVEVTYETASRNAEPYEQLITERAVLPNPAQRWCTQELKIRVMRDWMRATGYEHWTMVVGIRADEPSRVAKMRIPQRERWDIDLPLADARITEPDVMAFWARQPFDLHLKPYEGNCDICFLKHPRKRERIAKDRPDLLAWWIEQERRTGCYFRQDQPNYEMLPMLGNFFDADLNDADLAALSDGMDCHCTD